VLKGTLIEPARTNLLLRSEEFDSPYWTKAFLNVTGTPPWVNVAVAPDGTLTADKLIADNTSNLHGISRPFSGFSGAYTYSIFAKAGEYGYISFGQGNPGLRTYFDLVNGVVLGASSGVGLSNPKIENYGNGWYRCSGTVAASPATPEFIARPHPTGTGSETFTGDGTSGIFIWGAQLETGSVATSYIRTTDTAITQPADVITATGVSGEIGQTSGWVAVEVDVRDTGFTIVDITEEGITNNSQVILGKTVNGFRGGLVSLGDSPVVVVAIDWDTGGDTGKFKLVFKYASGELKFFGNGVLRGTSSATFSFTTIMQQICVGVDRRKNLNFFNNHISQVLIGKTAISDAEAIAWTTL
jgi:hypothetical protein